MGWITLAKEGLCVARGGWPVSSKSMSSTWRELRAARFVIESFVEVLGPCRLLHRTDNQAAAATIDHGSRHPHLHREAVLIFQLCQSRGIQLQAQWIPREENVRADAFLKIRDEDDWQYNPRLFAEVNQEWGPHSIDLFASACTSQLTRFGSRFWNPGCTVVDAFSISWQTELSWLCPPIHLIGRCIRKLQRDKADGSLLVPLWFSAPWWPMLIGHDKEFKSLVTVGCGCHTRAPKPNSVSLCVCKGQRREPLSKRICRAGLISNWRSCIQCTWVQHAVIVSA